MVRSADLVGTFCGDGDAPKPDAPAISRYRRVRDWLAYLALPAIVGTARSATAKQFDLVSFLLITF